jgi:hypothetical protein
MYQTHPLCPSMFILAGFKMTCRIHSIWVITFTVRVITISKKVRALKRALVLSYRKRDGQLGRQSHSVRCGWQAYSKKEMLLYSSFNNSHTQQENNFYCTLFRNDWHYKLKQNMILMWMHTWWDASVIRNLYCE